MYTATYAEDRRPAAVNLRRAIEALWLIAAFLVPMLILPDRAMVFVESPKVALLRGIAVVVLGLMVWEWALTPRLTAASPVSGFTARMGQWVREGPSQWVLGAAVLFLAAYLLSSLLSPVQGVSVFGREPGRDSFSLYSVATYMVLFFAVATHLRRPEQLQRLMWAIVASALVVSAYGIGQRWDFEPVREIADGVRVRSSFGNPLFFGSFLVMTMPLTLALMLWATRNLQALPRVLAIAAPVTVQMTALLFTLSRGPWVGLTAAMIVMAVVLGFTAGRRVVAIAGAVVAIAIVSGYLATLIPSDNSSSESVDGRVTERVSSIYTDTVGGSLSSRFEIWDSSFRVLADRPWVDDAFSELPSLPARPLRPLVGYGPDMFLYTLPLTGEPQLTGSRHYHAHNFLINTAVELGAIGFVTTDGLIAALAAAGLALFRRAREREFPPFVTLGLAGLLAAMAGRFVEQMGGVPQISDLTVFWLLAGVIVAAPSLVKHRVPVTSGGAGRGASPSGATSRTRIAIAIVIALGLGAFLWVANVRYVQASVIAASAGAAFKDGEFESSVQRLDKAIDLAPDVMAYRLNKAIALTALGAEMEDPDERVPFITQARREVFEAIERNPMAHRPWVQAADYTGELAYLDETNGPVAIRTHEIVAQLLPGYWKTHNAVAGGHLRFGNPEDALEALNTSVAITGTGTESSQALFLLGSALEQLERADDATIALEAALKLDPDSGDAREAHRLLSNLYLDAGNREEALKNRAMYSFHRAVQLTALDQIDEAISALEQSFEFDPAYPAAEAGADLLSALKDQQASGPTVTEQPSSTETGY